MYKLLSIFLCFLLFSYSSGQTPNNCTDYTSTGTSSSSTTGIGPAGCNSYPGMVSAGQPAIWTGTGCAGQITSTVTGGAVSCLAITYIAVNTNDYGTMSTNTGGALTITAINANVVGNVVGPYNCGGGFYGTVVVTVCSTIPFTSVTLLNTGCSSGWVINCSGQVTCTGSGNAGTDNFTTIMCSGTINMNTLVTGDPGGVWTETTGSPSGQFNTITGIFDATGLPNGTYNFEYSVSGVCAPSTAQFSVTISSLLNVTANASQTTICMGDSAQLTGSGAIIYTWDNNIIDGDYVSPTITTTYIVIGTDGNSCSDTDQVTIIVDLMDDASFIYPSATYCISSTDPPAIVTGLPGGVFSGSTGLAINPSNGTIDLDLSGAGTFIVYYTTNGNCINTDSTYIIIFPLPNVVANASQISFCEGDSTQLTGSGAMNYSWDNGVIDGDYVSPSATTTYTVTGTDANGCSNIDQITITINPPDDASFNFPNTTYCITETDPIAIITGLPGGVFSASNGLIINPMDGTIDLDLSGAGNYTVYYSSNVNCSNVDSVSIIIYDLPNVNGNASQTTICEGDSAQLTGSGAISYVWDNGVIDGNYVSPSITTTYIVTGTDGNGCIDTGQVTIIVSVLDDASFNYPNASYCISNLDPIALVTGVTGGIFSGNNGLTINSADGTIDLSLSGAGNYTIYYTTIGNCSNVDSTSIITNPLPNVIANASQTTICEGDSAQLTGSGAVSYFWDNGLLDGDYVNPTATTTYIVAGTDGNGCTDTAQVTISFLVITIDAGPNDTICSGDQTTITATSNASNFLWSNGEATASIDVHPITTTIYYVNASENLCTAIDTILIFIDTAGCDKLRMFFVPNSFTPNNDGINDYFFPVGTGLLTEHFEMTIFNRWGDVIFESEGLIGDHQTFAPSTGWNGIANRGRDEAQQDIYIWHINTLDADRRRHQYIGHVLLIR